MGFLTNVLESLRFEAEFKEAVRLTIGLLLGGFLSIYLRYLYRRCSKSVSNTDLISGIFPLLTVVTICVIAVVKSSLALSLGLVGALSIVRFRAAIKDPEELVWLFLCIAVGLAIGAGQLLYSVVLVFVISLFVFWRHFFSFGGVRHNYLLTISGNVEKHFGSSGEGVLESVREFVEIVSVQRWEIEENQGTMRLVIRKSDVSETEMLMIKLRERLPECHISHINLDTIL